MVTQSLNGGLPLAEDGDRPVNQPLWPENADLWAGDPVLRCHAGAAGGDAAILAREGARLGSADARANGRMAERNPPILERFDRRGARIDRISYHPSYHALMRDGIAQGYAALPWEGSAGGHVSHAALVYLTTQAEPGVCCPMTMTYAAGAVLGHRPDLLGRITSRQYDPSEQVWAAKPGLTFGMAMTEKQGGSDVRANLTTAQPDGEGFRLVGHKWFCSAPMSDGLLTLAQTEAGLSCFLVPRLLPDGDLNAVHLMRLKDKLGNRSNASAELEYRGAWAELVGELGDGIRAIIPMVHHTRLDTAMAPAGLMRAALMQAVHWSRGRAAFGRTLIDQPLMRQVLADLVLDWEGATALGLRVAAAYDSRSDKQAAFARVGVALAKFLSNKLAPQFIYECMECLGGMGFVEDTPLPMLYREAPLNSIWEGSGNVICLDILRTLARDRASRAALEAELDAGKEGDAGYDRALKAFRAEWRAEVAPSDARRFVEALAQLLTASVLLRQAPSGVAEGYVAARLGGGQGRAYGTGRGLDTDALLARVGEI